MIFTIVVAIRILPFTLQSMLPSIAVVKDLSSAAADIGLKRLQEYRPEDTFTMRPYSSWALSRLCQRERIIKDPYFVHLTSAGKGTVVYIFDNFITKDESRLKSTDRFILFNDYTSRGFDIIYKRGLQAASIIGHELYGVAPYANIVLNKVGYNGINNKNFTRNVLAAFRDAIGNVTARNQKAIFNLGLNFGNLTASQLHKIENYIKYAHSKGITIVKSAGNTHTNACSVNVSNMTEVISVGAINTKHELWVESETKASNYGPCVEIMAPGTDIYQSNEHFGFGTAFAAAHVTGIVATYLTFGVQPHDIKQTLIDSSTKNLLHFIWHTPNRTAFNMPTSHSIFKSYSATLDLYLKHRLA